MKYVRQFGIIIAIAFLGEVLKAVIPVNIPANIYGLLIMLTALSTKAVKLEEVKETANFLIEIMPIMFLPAGVGLMVSWKLLESFLIPFIVITVFSTVVVMVISGRVTQTVIRRGKRKDGQDERNHK